MKAKCQIEDLKFLREAMQMSQIKSYFPYLQEESLLSSLPLLCHLIYRVSQKNYTLFWMAVAPLNFELGIKIGGVLESSGSQLFKTVPTFDF